jgi:hypothetical protein
MVGQTKEGPVLVSQQRSRQSGGTRHTSPVTCGYVADNSPVGQRFLRGRTETAIRCGSTA